jgi:DNA-binding NtrC family response regulator
MRKRILVLDDEPALRRAMERELRRDRDVVVVASVEEAMATIEAFPDIVAAVSDLNLSATRTGLDFLRWLRDTRPEVVRVLVSGSWEPEQARASLEDGLVAEFLAKPWRYGELLTAIKRALERDERGAAAAAATATETETETETEAGTATASENAAAAKSEEPHTA